MYPGVHIDSLAFDVDMERFTKIVATLGPGVASPEKIRELVVAGMNVARLNFSHGDHQLHRRFVEWVRQAGEDEGRTVAVLQDISGHKLRVGRIPEGKMPLERGDRINLVPGRRPPQDPGTIPINYARLLDDVGDGDRVVMSDGMIRMTVVERHRDRLVAEVTWGGELWSGKGVAFPESTLHLPAVTDKDRRDLEFGIELGVDYVAASFVRTGADVRTIKELAGGTPVIAKVELAIAYQNLDGILAEAAGVMVARGDLGVQLPLARLPIVQADILRRTNRAGLISITATEMLESMTRSPRPTRAEVTDVATAVAAGTDAVMLSAETAVGAYPIRATEVMSEICVEIEKELLSAEGDPAVPYITAGGGAASAVARSAVDAAHNLGVETLVAFTESGSTARLLSKYRPRARIIALTPVSRALRQAALFWGVTPFPFVRRDHTDLMFAAAEKLLERKGFCQRDELVVMVAGSPPNQEASTNLIKVQSIGERYSNSFRKDRRATAKRRTERRSRR